MLGRRGAIVLACAAALVMPAAAQADAFDQLFKEYRSTGKIDGCKHSAKELAQAKRQVPNDIEQYAPDFPDALDAAAAARAKGGCDQQAVAATTATSTAAGTTATQAAPTSSTATATPAQPAAPTTATTPAPQADPQPPSAVADDAIPAAARAADDGRNVPVALVLVGALVLLALALWGLARWWAWEPPWLVRWRHATAEAGWRASAAWAEFTDWLRLGR
jgi:cobalamin biosynthesis Mg chelatase CobN